MENRNVQMAIPIVVVDAAALSASLECVEFENNGDRSVFAISNGWTAIKTACWVKEETSWKRVL
ncbi:hypothetical protein Ahy_A02g009006 isoform B [Arachis hypogaea]|uniref:Uncharacterized protein n=1 Tax=Arachis hypogaea TaxID=3818 RepID=A0A445EFN4_ARAHY|nr:hypothetical protein Ahy_A02g009006 isoform B [Arachis hypogaea]